MYSYIVEVFQNYKFICTLGLFCENFDSLKTLLHTLLRYDSGFLCRVLESNDPSFDFITWELIWIE